MRRKRAPRPNRKLKPSRRRVSVPKLKPENKPKLRRARNRCATPKP
jgi:hypothetical protein